METKTITYERGDKWNKETRSFKVVKKWAVVHTKSRTLIGGGGRAYDTQAECMEQCRNIVKNNPEYKVKAHFPEGVDAAPVWCYEHGDVHSYASKVPTFIQIKKEKGGNYVWSIYETNVKFAKMSDGEPDLETIKAEVLEIFPDAIFELLS